MFCVRNQLSVYIPGFSQLLVLYDVETGGTGMRREGGGARRRLAGNEISMYRACILQRNAINVNPCPLADRLSRSQPAILLAIETPRRPIIVAREAERGMNSCLPVVLAAMRTRRVTFPPRSSKANCRSYI